jgi:hypothetical protein
MGLTKKELVEYVRMAEHNQDVAEETLKQQAENVKDWIPVVRCKGCKHFAETKGKDSGKPCGYGKCMKPFFIQMIVDADDFCSYGERSEGE